MLKQSFLLLSAIFIINMTSCTPAVPVSVIPGEKLIITATLFPQYDFAREIAGEFAEVRLLLPPGAESHTFEPKPGDLTDIYNSDLFIYTGDEMEPWAKRILDGASNPNLLVADASEGILMGEHDRDEHEDHGGAESHDGHALDPHIWLDLSLAVKMTDNITAALCEKSPENAGYFTENARIYQEKLTALDSAVKEIAETSPRDTLVFGGRFAYMYFLERYGFNYVTAYDSCSSETEPSLLRMTEVIDYMKSNNVKYIFHEEFVDPKIAKSIAAQTNSALLLFSTAHNVTKDELDAGVTFIDIMSRNIENVRTALSE